MKKSVEKNRQCHLSVNADHFTISAPSVNNTKTRQILFYKYTKYKVDEDMVVCFNLFCEEMGGKMKDEGECL